MKRLLILLALVLSVHRATASLPFFDPFADATANNGTSYTVGSALAGQQNNATNIWNEVNMNAGGPLPLIVAGSLSYPDLPPGSGNSVSFVPATTTNQGARLNFSATVTNGPAYYSYLLKITNISAVPTTSANNWFAGWSDGSTAQPAAPVARVGTRILTRATNGGFVLGVGRNNTPSDYVFDTTIHNLNETIFIVGSYELVGGVTNVNLWINPPTNSFGSNAVPTPTVSAVHFSNTTGDLSTNRVVGFVIMCQNSNAPAGLIDEVRLGTNWTDVTGGNPAIITQPANAIVPSGDNASFSVVARGTPTLAYQWTKNGSPLSDGGNIFGSATATLIVSNVSGTDVAAYSVFVTNGLNNFVQSASASLALQTDPIINVQPQNFMTNAGGTATFQVTPGGTAPFSYQWHKVGFGDLSDTGNISGSHSNLLVLTGVAYSDSGSSYSVTVSNVNGTVDSTNATLTVLDPYFTLQPVSLTNGAGTTATFTVTAAGTGISTYQWYKNNNIIFDTGNLSGTATPTLTVSNISSTDQASYDVLVVGSYSTATSSVATLTVLSPVAMAIQPSPRTVAPGVRAVFVASASGSGPISYQWQLGGVNISNATSSTYIVSNAQPAVAGNYQLIVSNLFSSVTSSVAPLTVTANLTLSQSNLVVIRVGDGAQSLTLNGNSIYLDQYAVDGTYINTITVPDSGTNAMVDIGMDNLTGVNSGSTTGSCLTRSLDGRFMVIAGYNTNLTYGADLSQSAATNVPRGIGLIESHGTYTLPVADTSTNFTSTIWRAGLTDGTNNFWGGGEILGTYYFGFGASPALVQSSMVNMRSMSQYNGDIYCAGAQGTTTGVLKISGMPTAAAPATFLFSGSSGTFDMAVSPNGNLIYVADQRALASSGGIQRYDFNGSTWTLTYTLQVGGLSSAKNGPRYVTADFSGANSVIYVTSNDGTLDNNRIVVVVDTGSGSTGTALASAGINQTFRGIHFGPVPNTVVSRPTLSYSRSANNFVLSWSGAFSLQAATNVTGTYTNIPSASSPYTNNMNSASRMFFRLSQ